MDAKVAEIEAIFSTDENSEVKLKEVVNVLSALLKSPDRHGSLDVSASNGGFKAKIKEAGETKFVFQISKNEEEEYEEEENEEEQYEKEENEEETDSERGVIFRRYTNDYHQRGQLGRGAYGRVYRCTHKLDEGDYVIKMVPFIPKDRQKTLREVRALRISQHPNVVRYHQCWIERGVH